MTRLYDVNKLIAKFKIDNPPDPNNADAQAVLAGERNNPDNWFNMLLRDPDRSPELYAIITDAYHNFRRVKPERARELGEPEPFGPDAAGNVWRFTGNEGRCCISIANFCDGMVTDFTVSFGGLTMILPICCNCRAKVAEDAEAGLTLSAIAAAYDRPDPPERPR